MIDISEAKADTDELFAYLSDVADDILKKYSKPLDDMVKNISKNIDTLSNEEVRTYMMKISIEAYNLSLDREHTALKEACATALYKEGLATTFNTATGTVEARRNKSILESIDKQAVSILYSAVSALFKAKVDEAHRLANTLNTILISRASEAKLQYSPRSVGSADFNENENMMQVDGDFVKEDSNPF